MVIIVTEQTIPLGPVASQEAIKELGTNGGGFFNANSAHPFENPTPFTNMLEILAILIIPVSLCFTFGSMVQGPASGHRSADRHADDIHRLHGPGHLG